MWKIYLLMFIITAVISWLWARGIDKMTNDHSDYKGKDFLDWGDSDK